MPIIRSFFILFTVLLLKQNTFAQSNLTYTKQLEDFRKEYIHEFTTDENSPLNQEELKYLDFFPINERFKVTATFQLNLTQKPFEMLTSAGTTKTFVEYGKLFFELDNHKFVLPVYRNESLSKNLKYKDNLFLPFTDFTNNDSSYGGGRYIDLTTNDIKDDKVVIDFNKAYNPYCAFSDGWNCPIPPKDNHLKVRIDAGEKIPLTGH